MTAKGLVQLIIGAAGFVLEEIRFDTEMNQVIVAVHTTRREQCRCGICRRKAKRYDKGRGKRQWRSLDVGPWKTYVEAEEPRVICKEHVVVAAAVLGARHNSRFTKSFEETTTWLTVHSAKSVVAQFMRVE